EDGLLAAPVVLKKKTEAVFCCNDRLAEAVASYCDQHGLRRPRLIGFDDAPVAEALNLSTIAIPWQELVDASMAVIRKRLRGETSTAARQVLALLLAIRASNLDWPA